jgi:tRNA nucleotidyltransferase (CCA-adding enzyme)
LLLVLRMAAQLDAPLTVRFACLCHDLGKGATPAEILPRHIGHEQRSVDLAQALCERWRVPGECRELALLTAREHGNVHRSAGLDAAGLMRLFERCDALRRPERFAGLLLACECDARGRGGAIDAAYPPRPRLLAALAAVLAADTAAVAAAAIAAGSKGPAVGERIRAARIAAIRSHLSASGADTGA